MENAEWGDEKTARPREDTWEGRKAWLQTQQQRLLTNLRRLEAEGKESFPVGTGERTLPYLYVDSMAHHDAYHAAQIWYIRQRYAAELHEAL